VRWTFGGACDSHASTTLLSLPILKALISVASIYATTSRDGYTPHLISLAVAGHPAASVAQIRCGFPGNRMH